MDELWVIPACSSQILLERLDSDFDERSNVFNYYKVTVFLEDGGDERMEDWPTTSFYFQQYLLNLILNSEVRLLSDPQRGTAEGSVH